MWDDGNDASGKSGKDSKRDSKKKGGKPRPVAPVAVPETHEEDSTQSLSRLVSALAADIAALRAEMTVGKPGGKGKRLTGAAVPSILDAPLDDIPVEGQFAALRERAEQIATETDAPAAAVHLVLAHFPESERSESANIPAVFLRFSKDAATDPANRAEIEGPRNERAARIAASLGAEPRVTIARLLLTEPTLTAAQLGTGAELTTGSLYHHLREMTHAGILDVVARNRYTLTDLGRRSLLALLALAESNIAR